MQVLPIHTPLLKPGDDLAAALAPAVRAGDVVIVSSKAVATCEGAGYDLAALEISAEARGWAEKANRSPAFCEAVLRETVLLRGTVRGRCPQALLTEVRPDGLGEGSIIVPNAGLDESNVPPGRAVGWPHAPAESARALRAELERRAGGRLAVILTDSCCHPRRWGVSAFALTAGGIAAHRSEIGHADLYGRPLHVTVEAVADQLAVAGNAVMGNAAQSCPAAVIRDHGYPLTEDEGWVEAIAAERDIFRDLFRE